MTSNNDSQSVNSDISNISILSDVSELLKFYDKFLNPNSEKAKEVINMIKQNINEKDNNIKKDNFIKKDNSIKKDNKLEYAAESLKSNNIENFVINKTKDYTINNKIYIDIAVLCQEYNNIETICNEHIINLDEIDITKEEFQTIFYPYCDNFGINKNTVCGNPDYFPYISFLPEFRSIGRKRFYLLEEIISNIENDLNVSRNCFTKDSLVELTNEIISIKSLCDINCCSVLSSLTWENIIEIINNYRLIKFCDCEDDKNENVAIPICVINVIFKTPTCGVKNTIVRFNYRITNL